jgi:RNA polymerase sigma-70 factor (ECF subfamily)
MAEGQGSRDEDRQLVDRVLSGDPGGLVELYARHAPSVRGMLVRMVGRDAAEDLVQEVFLRACAHLSTFRGDSGLRWWLCRIAANCGARHLRGVRHAPVALPEEPLVSDARTPEDAVLAHEDRVQARHALARLGEDDRQLILLREIFGLSYEEIRERLSIPHLGTVRSRLHKAREALRRAWSTRG